MTVLYMAIADLIAILIACGLIISIFKWPTITTLN